ncbi:MAG: glycoside hydrolase family 27 protein [Candidatus Solibacter sp.]
MTKWLTLSTAALLSVALAGAQNLTGRWTGNAGTADDGLEVVVAIHQTSDGAITGYIQGQRSTDTITSGKVSGNAATLEAERAGRGGTVQKVTYTATVEGDKLKLTLPAFGGAGRGRGAAPGAAGTPGAAGAPGAAGTPGAAGAAGAPTTAPGAPAPPAAAAAPAAGRGPQQPPLELTRINTDVPQPLPPRPALVSLPMPTTAVKSNGMAKTPPMGWNSWNKFRNRVSDKMVREMADAIVTSGMRDAGYIYVNIDDTWESARRDAQGRIGTNNKFPDMKALADYVHGKGLKLGIYSSPGPKTCEGYLGTYGHEEQDAKTFAAWGIDYLKYDWCSAPQVYESNQATMAAAYAKMGLALLNSGRKIVYSLCQYGQFDVGDWGEKAGGNLWRTTGDISDRWVSMENLGFKQQLGREKVAGPGHWNDPDMLEIGNGGMTDTEYETHMSLWSLLSAPLLAGNDIRDMKPATAAVLMNKEVIAIDQDKLGKQAVRVSQDGTVEVWAKPLADGGQAVGLFNRGPEKAKVTAKWSDIGVKGPRKARDLWKHADLGKLDNEYSVEVPSHGVVMLRLSK